MRFFKIANGFLLTGLCDFEGAGCSGCELEAMLLEQGGEISDGFDDQVGTCGVEFCCCGLEEVLAFCGGQCGEFFEGEADGVASASDSGGEHSGVFAGLDADDGIIDDEDVMWGPDLEEFSGAEVEPWGGSSRDDIIGAESEVGMVSLLCGDRLDDLHEFAGVSGR